MANDDRKSRAAALCGQWMSVTQNHSRLRRVLEFKGVPDARMAYDRKGKRTVDWRELMFPELKRFDRPERERVLREAREDEFDSLEWIGVVASVVVATVIVGKLDLPAATGDRFLSTLLSFPVAIPLVGATAGVFMVRRTRRGLRKRFQKRAS